MKEFKLFVVGNDTSYVQNLTDLVEVTQSFAKSDMALFTGGADVSPSFYGESRHPRTHSDIERDRDEERYFKGAVELGIPMLGICRGAQFLTVMNGGKLYQDVTDHGVAGGHLITTTSDDIYPVTSTHHQMMKPWGVEHKLLAWSTTPLSAHYQGGAAIVHDAPEKEPEIVYYPKTRSLAIQPHPEYMPSESAFVGYVRELVLALYNNQL